MRNLRYTLTCALALGAQCQDVALRAETVAEPAYLYASQSGKRTLDQDKGGGNPFASALVELLARDTLTFEAFRSGLVELTMRESRGFQHPDVTAHHDLDRWQLLPKPATERRVALVLVFSDYSYSGAASSLPGAKHDMHRVAAALGRTGFEVQTAIDPDREAIGIVLKEFVMRSSQSDVAALYARGHGVEFQGEIYLLPGDYPFSLGGVTLSAGGLRLTVLASTLRARRVNLVFYGGCRDFPFGEGPGKGAVFPGSMTSKLTSDAISHSTAHHENHH